MVRKARKDAGKPKKSVSSKKTSKKSQKVRAKASKFELFLKSVLVIFDLVLFGGLAGFWIFEFYLMENAEIHFELVGDRNIEMKTGEKFEEPGYSAEYCTRLGCYDISGYVSYVINNAGDFSESRAGEYAVFYELQYQNWVKNWNLNEARTVAIYDDIPPKINLAGDTVIGIYEGDGYEEPGFSAEDEGDGDLTSKVETSGGVDSGTPGVYKVNYAVTDRAGNRTEANRYVFVYKRWYTASPTPTKSFDDLVNYIQNMGWDMSFGYKNFENGKSYTFQGDKVYYGASLVKTIDAMYAYEKTDVDSGTAAIIRGAITYSNNGSHKTLVDKYGAENLRNYASEIGMKHHLRGSAIYGDTYYFCDTTVDDQLAEWSHLWELINTNPRGGELSRYFINNYWDNLSFSGSPTHMYKNGLYGNNYHEVGIMFADSPYIVAFLSTEGWRGNSTTIIKDLSHRVYLINTLGE